MPFLHHKVFLRLSGALAVTAAAAGLMGQYGGAPIWWVADSGERMPLSAPFENKTGFVLVYNAGGETATRNHAFFTPMGSNGRACITCHQLSAGMSVTTDRLEERWGLTAGQDPVFAAVDGSNCPSLPQDDRESHSLLLNKGLFRIAQPWPAPGVTPEFSVEVVRDPTGCNVDARYGLHAKTPMISVFRRPRPVGNLKYLADGNAFTADSRSTTLEAQAIDAVHTHEQGAKLSAEELQQIVEYERQIYVSQGFDRIGGDLTEVGGPQGLGAWQLGRSTPSHTAANAGFLTVAHWSSGKAAETAFRASVERGSVLFSQRTFDITDTANLDHAMPHAAKQGTCATCHSEHMTGANTTQPWMDIGTASLPWAGDQKDLPLFKITCSATAEPHPLGRVIYTNDPGRALVTGKCRDVGSLVIQQLRGLSARAPYFTGGSAKDLRAVVDYYDKRYAAHYTEQEKQDLVNFMRVL